MEYLVFFTLRLSSFAWSQDLICLQCGLNVNTRVLQGATL